MPQQNPGKRYSRTVTYKQIEEFIQEYPFMSIRPSKGSCIILEGKFWFRVTTQKQETVEDDYLLRISIPQIFPKDLPSVCELESRIPRDGNHHINPDGTLCLGSPLRLLSIIQNDPTVKGFAINCLEPFLLAVTMKLRGREQFEYGELAHGSDGIISDYACLLKLNHPSQVIAAIRLLCLKKRIANKKQCPCGCKRRLGACYFHKRLNQFRTMASPSWFKKYSIPC